MLSLQIITPSGIYLQNEVKMINISTIDGKRGILTNHIPFVTMLDIDTLSLDFQEGRELYSIAGGMFHLDDNNKATILTDAIENVKDIDVNRAIQAKEKAEKLLKSKQMDKDMVKAEAALKKAINRINSSKYV